MAQFYRVKTAGQPDALYDASTNQKILNEEAFKSGGYTQEIQQKPIQTNIS